MNNFTRSEHPAQLSAHCAAATRANADLVGSMLQALPAEKLEALDGLLAGGGSIGAEITTDYRARITIRLVAIEREGTRLVLATIGAPEAPAVPQ